MTPEEIQAVFARHLQAWAARDVSALVAPLAEDCVLEGGLLGTIRGRSAAEARFRRLLELIPDLQVERGEPVIMGDHVVVAGRYVGTRSGKHINLEHVVLYTFRDGQIARARVIYDLAEHLQRMQTELRAAADVQRALQPQAQFAARWFEVAAASVPCLDVGGDFFDYFELSENAFGFVLGDVAGKGPPAALLSATLQGILGVHTQTGRGPADTLAQVNRALLRRAIPSRFAAAVYATLSSDGSLTYCNAGHNPPLLFARRDRSRLEVGGMVLGLFDDAKLVEQSVQLQTGDVLVMFSDGVTEAFNGAGEEFGEKRLAAVIEANLSLGPASVVSGVLDAVRTFTAGAAQSDDVTILALRCGRP